MTVLILFFVSMTMAYQANKPCDKACFQERLDREVKIEHKQSARRYHKQK